MKKMKRKNIHIFIPEDYLHFKVGPDSYLLRILVKKLLMVIQYL